MEIESLEIHQYLSQCEPFSKLEKQQQIQITRSIEIVYFRRGSTILWPGAENHWLYIVRSGAAERSEENGQVVAKFSERDIFGQASLARKGIVKRKIIAIEDCLLYRIPRNIYDEYSETSPYFRFYFERSQHKKNIYTRNDSQSNSNLSSLHAKELLVDKPHIVDHKQSVAQCAQLMQQKNATYLLITQN
ncbi:MAG: cyclic nucleotide-binding domain-containing protein, partial [Kangiellaceae bacterium]|nr:cyclic nucleotide-binding domain-containing protein [Kangiellaceae bacterium]